MGTHCPLTVCRIPEGRLTDLYDHCARGIIQAMAGPLASAGSGGSSGSGSGSGGGTGGGSGGGAGGGGRMPCWASFTVLVFILITTCHFNSHSSSLSCCTIKLELLLAMAKVVAIAVK